MERNLINIAQDIDENQSQHKQLEGEISELERLRWYYSKAIQVAAWYSIAYAMFSLKIVVEIFCIS